MNLVNKSDTVKLFGLPAERGRWLLIALGIILGSSDLGMLKSQRSLEIEDRQ